MGAPPPSRRREAAGRRRQRYYRPPNPSFARHRRHSSRRDSPHKGGPPGAHGGAGAPLPGSPGANLKGSVVSRQPRNLFSPRRPPRDLDSPRAPGAAAAQKCGRTDGPTDRWTAAATGIRAGGRRPRCRGPATSQCGRASGAAPPGLGGGSGRQPGRA